MLDVFYNKQMYVSVITVKENTCEDWKCIRLSVFYLNKSWWCLLCRRNIYSV